jgi:hypothetical protein
MESTLLGSLDKGSDGPNTVDSILSPDGRSRAKVGPGYQPGCIILRVGNLTD